jgi:drug/metabolite transporter (DMT)-like permease
VQGNDHAGRAVGLVLFIGTAWGITYALYPVGLREAGPLWLAALRFDAFCLGAFLACWAVDGGVRAPTTLRDFGAIATYAGLNITLHNLATIGGSGHVPVAVVGLLAGLTPILTAALAPLLLPDQRPSKRLVAGLLVGFVGVAVLVLSRPGGSSGAPLTAWTLVVFVGFLAWALGAIFLKAARSPLPSLSVGFWGALASVAVLNPLALTEPMPVPSLTLGATVLFIGLVGGVGGFVAWMRLVRRFGPAQASLPSFVSPAVASLAGMVLVQQPLGWGHLVAYLLVAGGLALAARDLMGAPARPLPGAATDPAAAVALEQGPA